MSATNMITQARTSPEHLPIKKRYMTQIYAKCQNLIKPAEPKRAPKVATIQPPPVIMPVLPLVIPPAHSQSSSPILPMPKLQPQLQDQQQQTDENEQQVMQPEQGRRRSRLRNLSCYLSFNFKFPQLAPLDLTKNHKCFDCTKIFRKVDRLKAHKRRYDIKKSGRYTCEVCSKPFVQQSSLITHRRIHTGEKPYQCKVCNNSYGDLSTYTKHTRTHTGVKPYKCEYCDQRFSQSGNCLRHKRSVHADVFTWV